MSNRFEADTLCHAIAMINKGKLVALGTPAEIKQQFSKINIVEVTIKEPRKGLSEEIAKIDGVERVDSVVEGTFPKLVIQTRIGANLSDRIIILSAIITSSAASFATRLWKRLI